MSFEKYIGPNTIIIYLYVYCMRIPFSDYMYLLVRYDTGTSDNNITCGACAGASAMSTLLAE